MWVSANRSWWTCIKSPNGLMLWYSQKCRVVACLHLLLFRFFLSVAFISSRCLFAILPVTSPKHQLETSESFCVSNWFATWNLHLVSWLKVHVSDVILLMTSTRLLFDVEFIIILPLSVLAIALCVRPDTNILRISTSPFHTIAQELSERCPWKSNYFTSYFWPRRTTITNFWGTSPQNG